MMMELDILLKSVSVVRVEGDTARNITGINMDSRLVQPGDLFVAVKGTQADGHAYIGKAIEKGAVAVVCEAWPEERLRKCGGTVGYGVLRRPDFQVATYRSDRYERQNYDCHLII